VLPYSSAVSEWPFLPFPVRGWFLSSLSLIFRHSSRREVPNEDGQRPRRTPLFYFRFVSSSGTSTKIRTSLTHPSRFYLFSGLFVVCNTILCSVGVWNLSLVQTRSFYNGSSLFASVARVRPPITDRYLTTSTYTTYSTNLCLHDLFGSV